MRPRWPHWFVESFTVHVICFPLVFLYTELTPFSAFAMKCAFIPERSKPRMIANSSCNCHILSKNFPSGWRITNLIFADEDNPKSRENSVRIKIQDILQLSQWGMQLKEANKKSIHLSVMTSAQAVPSHYGVMVETKSRESSGETALYRCKNRERICLI